MKLPHCRNCRVRSATPLGPAFGDAGRVAFFCSALCAAAFGARSAHCTPYRWCSWCAEWTLHFNARCQRCQKTPGEADQADERRSRDGSGR
jgi:hypothetical protein